MGLVGVLNGVGVALGVVGGPKGVGVGLKKIGCGGMGSRNLGIGAD